MPTPDLQSIADILYGAAQPAINAQPDAVSGVGAPAPAGIQDPWAQEAAAAMAPPPSTPTPAPALPSNVGSVSTSQSTGETGYSPDKMALIQAGPQGQAAMSKQQKASRGAIEGRFAPYKQGLADVATEDLQTEQRAEDADVAKINAMGYWNGRKAAMINEHASWTMKHNEATALAKQQSKDEYRAKLLEIKEVNPNALWDDAGTTGQIGIAAAAILHEMLGVKGIKTSAMDTINNAIRNKIDSQIANINKQQKVASGFKDLYEMTVAESASEQEARDKMQGYMLQALDKQVDATLAPYDSAVARVKHAQAKSMIRKASLEAQFKVDDHIEKAYDQAEGRRIAIRGQDLNAAIHREDRAHAEKLAALKAASDAKNSAKAPPVIYDTSKSGKGAAKWRVKPQYADDKELQRDLIKKTVFTNKAVDGMRELIELQKKIDGSPPAIAGRLRSELARREEALRSVVVSALILDLSGKAATEGEQVRIAKQVPEQGWFTNGDNRKIISQRVLEKTKEMNDFLAQSTDALKEGDSDYGTFASTNEAKYGEGESIDADASLNPGEKSRTQTLLETAQSPEAMSDYSVKDNVSRNVEFKQYTKPYWEAFQREYSQVAPGRTTVPKAFDAVRELAEEAHSGDKDAAAKLEALATVAPEGSRNSKAIEVRSMAKFFLDKIDHPGVPGTEGASGFGIETDQVEDATGDRAGDEADSNSRGVILSGQRPNTTTYYGK